MKKFCLSFKNNLTTEDFGAILYTTKVPVGKVEMVTQQDVSATLRQISSKMVSYLRVKYNSPDFDPAVKITFAENRRVSRGGIRRGQAFINIVAKRFLAAANTPYGIMDEPEYKSFNGDRVIGGLYGIIWQRALASLVAHELGHAVQYYGTTKVGAKKVFGIEDISDDNDSMRGHDWFWKKIYADLRTQFVNGPAFDHIFVVGFTQPQQESVKTIATQEPEPVKSCPPPGALYVKYRYKGDATYSEFYISGELKVVIAEINRKFYRFDPFGGDLELLPFKSLVEARKNLIGQ